MSKSRIKRMREQSRAPETETSSTESKDATALMIAKISNAKRVKVRSSPEKVPGNVVEILGESDVFEVLEIIGDFCRIELHDGRIGYIAYEFCQEVSS